MTAPAARRRAMGSVLVALLTWLAACSRAPDAGFNLAEAAASNAAATAAGLSLPPNPIRDTVTHDGVDRHVVLTPLAGWSWSGRVPAGAWLALGAQLVPAAWDRASELVITVEVTPRGGGVETVASGPLRANAVGRWLDLGVDLSRFAGRQVTLAARAAAPGLEAEAGPVVAWGPVSLTGAAERTRRPNILLIVVDTLRADHLGSYGYALPTSPAIDRHLGRRGVVFERAYAQAPWTVPSMVSLVTGRWPGELWTGDPAALAVPEAVEGLAEQLAAAGYTTAGFVANPLLHPFNGFARGFGTYYVPRAGLNAMELHGGEVTRRALPWLEAQRGRPYFAWLHYLDPHDPYDSPLSGDDRNPFYPGVYTGRLSGRSVHMLHTGHAVVDGSDDAAWITSLYDAEIAWVDRQIGFLLERLGDEALRDTVVVLTSDHGEELLDHGGWKHGHTMYDEQIRVPLIVRWDGRFRAGLRVRGTTRLVDVVPSLAAAAGLPSDPEWDGVDLGPTLRGQRPLPRLAAYAQNFQFGPLRAAAMADGQKLMRFDAAARFAPTDSMGAHFWRLDVGRLAPAALFDLDADPREARPLAGATPPALAAVLEERLDVALPAGLRVVATNLPSGARLLAKIALDRPDSAGDGSPPDVVPYFLGTHDRWRWEGSSLVLELAGETPARGVIIQGDQRSFNGVDGVEATFEDGSVPAVTIVAGDGTYAGGAVRVADAIPAAPQGPSLRLWWGRGRRAPSPPRAENVERLRALGYIQ